VANYTSNYNLYKPSRLDKDLDVDNTLSPNFETIDTELKNRKDEIDEVSVRVNTIVGAAGESNVEIVDARGGFGILRDRLTANDQKFSNMRDPLAYLNSVEVICSFSARGSTGSDQVWTQGFSINEATNEIYIAVQGNGGIELRIDIRNLDGSFKSSKTLPIDSGAYTEALPFFYNANNELCFIICTQDAETRTIYNYTTGVLGTPFAVKGKSKSAVDGNYFVTCDATTTTLKTMYLYDWDSIKAGTPTLLQSFRVSNYGSTLFEKGQGLVLNNGYIFFAQGGSGGNPALTVYNTAGQLVNGYLYTKESVAKAVNAYFPDTIIDLSGYSYENEGGCIYKGKLVTAQIINSVVYLFVHNSTTGIALETKVPIYRIDTDWQSVTLLNGALDYASDGTTTPRIRRIGNQILLTGAIKGFTAMNVEYLEFPSSFAHDRNAQFTSVTSNSKTCNWQIQPNGRARILNTTNTTLDVNTWYPFHFTWFI
jgi:hypothetical protein